MGDEQPRDEQGRFASYASDHDRHDKALNESHGDGRNYDYKVIAEDKYRTNTRYGEDEGIKASKKANGATGSKAKELHKTAALIHRQLAKDYDVAAAAARRAGEHNLYELASRNANASHKKADEHEAKAKGGKSKAPLKAWAEKKSK